MVCGDKGNLQADQGLTPTITDLYEAQLQLRASREYWLQLAQPSDGFAAVEAGPVTLQAAVNAPAGVTAQQVEFIANDQVVGVATAHPWSVSWNAPADAYNLRLRLTDSLGRQIWGVPSPVTVARRRLVQDNDPALTYTGSWATDTGADLFGDTARRCVTEPGRVDFAFRGTRVRIYSRINNVSQNYYIYLNDFGTPVRELALPNNFTAAGSPVWDSGELPNGVHRLRLVTTVGLILDAFEVVETGSVADGNVPPFPSLRTNTTSGFLPLAVSLDARDSGDLDGSIVSYAWDFGDGTTATGSTVQKTYTRPGLYTARLTVTDNAGATATLTRQINASGQGVEPVSRLVVNWTGRRLTSNFNFRNTSAFSEALDLDADGTADDRRAGWLYSPTVPLTTSPLVNGSPSYYGVPVYGAVVVESLNTTSTHFGDNRFERRTFTDSFNLRYGPASVGREWVVLHWNKEDFVNQAHRFPISFDSRSRLQLAGISRFDSLGQVRWLLREGNQWFISETRLTNSSGTAALTFASDEQDGKWAPFDPASTTYSFDLAAVTFAPQNFADITAVGLAVTWPGTYGGGLHWLNFTDFTVTARVATGETHEAARQRWKAVHFSETELANPALEASRWGDQASPDGDALPNLVESWMGTHPQQFDRDRAFRLILDGNQPRLLYQQANNMTGVTGWVEYSTDGLTWQTTGISERVLRTEATTTQREATLPAIAQGQVLVRIAVRPDNTTPLP